VVAEGAHFYNHRMDAAWMYYIWALLLVSACAVGWLLSLVALPGNWVVLGLAAVFAWLFPENETGSGMTWLTIGALAVLAVIGEIVEFAAGAAGAAKQGASRRGVALSIVGAMVGSIAGLAIGTPIPILGSFVMALLGGAAGAYAGAYLGEAWKGRPEEDRTAAGRGAFAGRIWGTVGKLVVGVIMLAIVVWDAFL
jgi:uncharacterized protein YqgC (DUF456 family)